MVAAIGIGIGALAASLAIGIGWLVLRKNVPAPTAQVVLTTEQVAAKCEASVGFVSGPSSSGTGFLVADGLLATNAHVIDSTPPDQIQITFPAAPELDRGPILGRVVYFDPARDLAILRVSTRLRPLKTASNHQFRRGQDVVVIGNPGLGNGRSLECVVSRGVLGSKIVEDNQPFYQLSGSVNPGNSGGPALDLSGEVVGVVTLKASKQEGLGFCIPAPDLARAIGATSTQPEPSAQQAAQCHLAIVKGSAWDAKLMAILGRTDPATWIAMVDLDRELSDESSEAMIVRALLDQADQLYQEDRSAIVSMVFNIHSLAKKSGNPVMAVEVLAGSLDWAPRQFFTTGKTVEFATYAQLYIKYHGQRKTHEATLASLRELYQETLVRAASNIAPPLASGRRSGQESQQVIKESPKPESDPTSSNNPKSSSSMFPLAQTESLRLGRSLEKQNKQRGALRYYRDLVDDYPGTPEADEAAQRIAILTRPPSFGNRPPAKVLEVLDGRTIVIDLGGARTTVRLLGLDPLPKKHSVSPRGSWEDQTAAFLRDLVKGRSVHLDYERGVSQSDGENHTLAYLYRSGNMLAVNREMIARGFGVASRFGVFSQAEDFRDADARARSRKVGLWQP